MKTFQFVKECRVCNFIYYKQEITEEAFVDLERNPHTRLDYDSVGGLLVGTAKIVSICDDCSRVVNSKHN